ncbi:MAG: malate synthase A [Thermomicrobiales bacterium]|nr:malate synthase A [Thermomicrobiales bacterium]
MERGIEILGQVDPEQEAILSAEALAFVADLHREFAVPRLELLAARHERQAAIDAGAGLDFLKETAPVRDSEWQVAPAPADLNDRRVEITGPCDRKMVINALNSGAKVFMADLEDASSPTWRNVIDGQINLRDAVRRTISFQNPDGREYRLNDETATLLVRPRGWHLPERHLRIDGAEASGSLVDFGLYFFHNARELIERGSGPYFYLPKLQGHREARLWNDVFTFAQQKLGIPHGSVRATVLVETLPAAFEMEEILYELRDHAAGLNAGRWDYIFSAIKTFQARPDTLLPDRAQVTMTVPFMRAYALQLVKICHKRGAHAIGGMSAFIPSRDPEANEIAFAKVREDKEREAGDGYDGTWVAHPRLAPVAMEAFDAVLGARPNQKGRQRDDVVADAAALTDFQAPGGAITEDGIRANTSIAIQYIDNWLRGTGAAAIYNLMEDAATAEISRAQLWQWIHHRGVTADGQPISAERYQTIREEELAKLGGAGQGRQGEAAKILDELVLADEFAPFLTLPAYSLLD